MTRYEELLEKRDTAGLTDQEADELGRLIAEREGRAYANADDIPTPVNQPRIPSDDRMPPGPKEAVGHGEEPDSELDPEQRRPESRPQRPSA